MRARVEVKLIQVARKVFKRVTELEDVLIVALRQSGHSDACAYGLRGAACDCWVGQARAALGALAAGRCKRCGGSGCPACESAVGRLEGGRLEREACKPCGGTGATGPGSAAPACRACGGGGRVPAGGDEIW